MDWIIAGVFISLLIIAFLYEFYRVPQLDRWCRLHGFYRLVEPFPTAIEAQLKRLVKMYGPLNKAWNFGFAFQGTMMQDRQFLVAEHDLVLPSGRRYWHTLFSLTDLKQDFGEFRVVSVNQTAEGIGRVIEIIIFPVFLLFQALPKRKEVEGLLASVDFTDDPRFDQAYKVYGGEKAAKRALNSDVRLSLLQRKWKGELAAAGDTLVWRRKGLLNQTRIDNLLPETELMQALFFK